MEDWQNPNNAIEARAAAAEAHEGPTALPVADDDLVAMEGDEAVTTADTNLDTQATPVKVLKSFNRDWPTVAPPNLAASPVDVSYAAGTVAGAGSAWVVVGLLVVGAALALKAASA